MRNKCDCGGANFWSRAVSLYFVNDKGGLEFKGFENENGNLLQGITLTCIDCHAEYNMDEFKLDGEPDGCDD